MRPTKEVTPVPYKEVKPEVACWKGMPDRIQVLSIRRPDQLNLAPTNFSMRFTDSTAVRSEGRLRQAEIRYLIGQGPRKERNNCGDFFHVLHVRIGTVLLTLIEVADGLSLAAGDIEEWQGLDGQSANYFLRKIGAGQWFGDHDSVHPDSLFAFIASNFYTNPGTEFKKWVTKLCELEPAFSQVDLGVKDKYSSQLARQLMERLTAFQGLRMKYQREMISKFSGRQSIQDWSPAWAEAVFSLNLAVHLPPDQRHELTNQTEGVTAVAFSRSLADTYAGWSTRNCRTLRPAGVLCVDANRQIDRVKEEIIRVLGGEEGEKFFSRYIYPFKPGGIYAASGNLWRGARAANITYEELGALCQQGTIEAVHKRVFGEPSWVEDFACTDGSVPGREDEGSVKMAVRKAVANFKRDPASFAKGNTGHDDWTIVCQQIIVP